MQQIDFVHQLAQQFRPETPNKSQTPPIKLGQWGCDGLRFDDWIEAKRLSRHTGKPLVWHGGDP